MRSPVRARLGRVLAAAGLTAALLSPAPTLVGAAEEGKTLRVGTIQEFDSLNPNLAYLVSSYEAFILNYDLLVGFGPDLEYAPTGFATAWELDGATWKFTIRDGMKWSDGEPADASDVAFTYQYLLDSLDPEYTGPWAPDGNDADADGAADNPLSLFGDFLVSTVELQSIEVVDATHVNMTTAFPTQLFLGAYIPILPEHIWGDVTFASAATDFQVDPPVVGTGPFQVVEWKRGEFARFERNENYWGKQPYIDEVIFQFYGNADAMTQALRGGTVDYIRGVIPEQYPSVDAEDDIVGVDAVGPGWTQLAFNTYGTDIPGGGASTKALRDPAFRVALDRAVDRDTLVEEVLNGYGIAGSTPVAPTVAAFRKEPANPRPFDLDAAAAALEAAGYVDSNGNGTREDKEGKEINLRIYFPDTDDSYPKSGQFIADWWKEIGIGVTLQSFDSDTLTSILYTPESGGTADYDIELWGWAQTGPDPDFLLSIFTTSQIGVWSDSSYSDPGFDALYDQQKQAATFEERKAIVGQMQDQIYDEAPYIILFYDDELHAYRNDKFEGWTLQPRDGGVGLFATGVETYLNLVPVGTSTPSTEPGSPTATPGASQPPGSADGNDSNGGLMLVLGVVGLAAIIAVGIVLMRRRQPSAAAEDDD